MFGRKISYKQFVRAAFDGDVAVVKEYIAQHAKNLSAAVNPINDDYSAIFAACSRGNAAVVAVLLKLPVLNVNAGCGPITPLFIATSCGYDEVVKLLIEDGRVNLNAVSDNSDPLEVAIEKGHVAIVKLLLDAGTDVKNYRELRAVAVDNECIEIAGLLAGWKEKVEISNSLAKFAVEYLPEHDQLSLRTTCRFYRDLLQKSQPTPCVTKAQFVMTITCHFKPYWQPKKVLSEAWNCYKMIINAADTRPAIIHKLRESSLDMFWGAREQLKMVGSGRIYYPADHCWAFNAIWVIANVHKRRSFHVVSSINDDNFLRPHHGVSSAFAREIAVVMRMGYTPCMLNDNTVRLDAPHESVQSNVTIREMKLTETYVTIFYRQLKKFKDLEATKPAQSQCHVM